MGRRLLAILAALAVAVVGAVTVVLYASAADSRAVAGQQTVEVYLARSTVPQGTTVRQAAGRGLIARQSVVAKGVPAGALSKVGPSNEDLVATSAIQPGEIVLASRFGTKVPAAAKTQQTGVPAGKVAVTVTLADAQRVAPLLAPGSHIVLFDSFNPRDSKAAVPTPDGGKLSDDPEGQRVTRVVLDDVLVIGVGSDLQQTGPGTPQTKSDTEAQSSTDTADSSLVTVAVTPAQSVTLVHAIQTGTLYAGLLGTDSKVDDRSVVTDDTVLGH